MNQTDTFNITVVDTIDEITISETPKTTFNYNDPFEAIGGRLALKYASGAKSISVL